MNERTRPRGRVLVVEDEAYVRASLREMLAERGYEVVEAGSVAEAVARLERTTMDVVLTDFRMPGADGLEMVRQVKANFPEVPVVVLTGQGTIASAVECLRAGASDYILKPADPEALEVALERAVAAQALKREVRYLRGARAATRAPLGESQAWKRVLAMVDAAAATDSPVLLRGESGTGKELLARRLHHLSPRAASPYISVNCAAVPIDMWEAEFFGHRKGAFTGAASERDGLFVLADRGTLFLDEVAAAPLADPGQAPARPAGRRVQPPGRRTAHPGGRSGSGRHQRGPAGGDQAGALPARPLLSPERAADRGPPAARAAGGHPPAGGRHRGRAVRPSRAPDSRAVGRARSSASRAIPGPATCESCAAWWSGPSSCTRDAGSMRSTWAWRRALRPPRRWRRVLPRGT